jgi:hypothetical protein
MPVHSLGVPADPLLGESVEGYQLEVLVQVPRPGLAAHRGQALGPPVCLEEGHRTWQISGPPAAARARVPSLTTRSASATTSAQEGLTAPALPVTALDISRRRHYARPI